MQLNVGYTNSDLRRPQNDNNSFGVVSASLLGRAADCTPIGAKQHPGLCSRRRGHRQPRVLQPGHRSELVLQHQHAAAGAATHRRRDEQLESARLADLQRHARRRHRPSQRQRDAAAGSAERRPGPARTGIAASSARSSRTTRPTSTDRRRTTTTSSASYPRSARSTPTSASRAPTRSAQSCSPARRPWPERRLASR